MTAVIEVRDVVMRYGSRIVMRDLNFSVTRGEIFVIMGGSGSGKSTLLRHLIGFQAPATGSVLMDGADLFALEPDASSSARRRMGVLFQNGALWSGLTLAENVAFPIREFTTLGAGATAEIVELKLALVGLRGFGKFYPSAISGGMRKRAALARAIALDPDVLLFDEPSSGLDPVSASRLDDLILQMKASLGTTIVVVTHDLASIERIADRAAFLDIEQKTMTALGTLAELRAFPPGSSVRQFLSRQSEGTS